MIGPYAAGQVDGLTWTAQLLYGETENDLTRSGVTVSFDSERLLIQASLQGERRMGALMLYPNLSATFAEDEHDPFIDPVDGPTAAGTTRLRDLTAALDFATPIGGATHLTGGGAISAASVDRSAAASANLFNGLSGSAHLGINRRFSETGHLSLSASAAGLGANGYESYGATASLSFRF